MSFPINADAVDVGTLFNNRFAGQQYNPFMIPSYQRTYRWGQKNAIRIDSFIDTLIDDNDDTSFFGALIISGHVPTFSAGGKRYINPSIVDGQQRITTLYLILTRCYLLKLVSLPDLGSMINLSLGGFKRNIKDLVLTGSDSKNLQNIMIRRQSDDDIKDDSKKSEMTRYQLWYNKEIITNLDNSSHTPEEVKNTLFGEFDTPEQALYNSREKFKEFLNEDSKDKLTDAIECIDKRILLIHNTSSDLDLNAFIKRVLDAVLVDVFITSDKDHQNALNVFHALNTGGEPLTALESFKSHAFLKIATDYKDQKNIKNAVDSIYCLHEKHLDNISDVKIPNYILNTVSWLIQGKSLRENVYHQGKFLKDYYSTSPQALLDYLKLSIEEICARGFSLKIKNKSTYKTLNNIYKENDLLKFFVYTMGAAEQQISTPLAIYCINRNMSQEDSDEIYKAASAFTILWRMHSGGSANSIEKAFKSLYEIMNSEDLTPNQIKSFFYNSLVSHVQSDPSISFEDSWIRKIKSLTNFYRSKSSLKRIFIGLILESTKPEFKDDNLSYNLKVKSGLTALKNPWEWLETIWEHDIEHIAPKHSNSNWHGSDIYLNNQDSEPQENALGNLTVIHKSDNRGILVSKSWEDKKIIYNLLSLETEEERLQYLQDLADKIEKKFYKQLSLNTSDKYLNKYLDDLNQSPIWNRQLLKKRTIALSQAALTVFENWLK